MNLSNDPNSLSPGKPDDNSRQMGDLPVTTPNPSGAPVTSPNAKQTPEIANGPRKRQTDVKRPPGVKSIPQIPTHPSNYIGAEYPSTPNNQSGRNPALGKLAALLGCDSGGFKDRWNSTEAAGEFGPVPKGDYICHATKGELDKSLNKGTPSFKIEFTIIEGAFQGRKLWHNCWLTPAALGHSKRDLQKLGITSPEDMEQPLERGIRCKVSVVLHRDDDLKEWNKVKSFTLLGIDKPEPNPYAPKSLGNTVEADGTSDTNSAPDKS